MDTIQLALDVRFKRTIQNSHRFFFKQQDLLDVTHTLLFSYSEWLRKINTTLNKRDVIHQNEQKNNEFKFLIKFNLLFFLTVTRQFNVIEQLFKTRSFTQKQCHSIVLAKKIDRKAKQKKRNRLTALFAPKIRTYNLEKKKHDAHDLSDMNQIKMFMQLSPKLKIKKIKTPVEELEQLMPEYHEDELCIEKPHLSSAGHTNLTFFAKCTKQSIYIKNRPFMAQRLTFFSSSPQYKHRSTKQCSPSYNLNEQKIENNMRICS
ncbi:hypothetical protein [Legionella sp. WA2022007384]